MASTPPKPSKQLGELLLEQQEPFILEVYLLERGCLKKSSNSEGNLSCCCGNSTNFLKRSASCGLNKSRNGVPRCSKMLGCVCKKFLSIKEDQRRKSSENRNEENSVTAMERDDKEVAESDRFSSASSTTVFNSCSESDKEEISTSSCKDHTFDAETFPAMKLCNAATDRKLRRRCKEDSKQLSPVSVLEEISSHEGQQNARIRQENNSTACPKKVLEDYSLSSAPPRLPLEKSSCTGVAELQGLGESNSSPQFLKSKMVLQQTKQLLFDCVREVVETHARKERGQQHYKEFLGPEELGRLICERMKLWGKQAGDETNINYFLDLDFLDSVKEWSAFEQQREIALEIGDAILEEIKNEVVMEIIDFLAATRC